MGEHRDETPAKLRWRCRRGMQELDVMLLRWLDLRWPEADEASRRAFEALLDREDDLLWDWLSGRGQPTTALAAIVAEIRDCTFGPERG